MKFNFIYQWWGVVGFDNCFCKGILFQMDLDIRFDSTEVKSLANRSSKGIFCDVKIKFKGKVYFEKVQKRYIQ